MKNDESVAVEPKDKLSSAGSSSAGGVQPLQSGAAPKGKVPKRMHYVQSRYMLPPSSLTKENTPLSSKDASKKPPSTNIAKKSLFTRGPSLTPSRSKPPPKRLESPVTSTPSFLQMSMTSVPGNISCISSKSVAQQQAHRPISATNLDITTKNLKVRKQQVPSTGTGPMLGLPEASASDGEAELTPTDEAYLVYSRYIAARFLHLRSKEALDKCSTDGIDKLWRLSQLNKQLCQQKTSLEVELNTFRHNRLFREHLAKQKEVQDKLLGDLPSFIEKFSEIASGLDACLHYLPLGNVRVPKGPEELGKLGEDVDKLNAVVGSALSAISLSNDKLVSLANCLSTNQSILSKQAESVERYKTNLLELKKVFSQYTFLSMKKLQQKTAESDDVLFGCADLTIR